MDTYGYIISDSVLSKAFKFIVDNSTSNTAPYHNLHHIVCVTHNCILAQRSYHRINKEIGSDITSFKTLLIASLFHDVNHSMGTDTDDVNVQNSIKLLSEFYGVSDVDVQNSFDLEYAISIIEATQYPYVINSGELSESQKIIRDADLLMFTEDSWFQYVILGLRKEMNISKIEDMLNGQIKFISNVKMNTDWGRDIYDNKIGSHISRLNGLLELYK